MIVVRGLHRPATYKQKTPGHTKDKSAQLLQSATPKRPRANSKRPKPHAAELDLYYVTHNTAHHAKGILTTPEREIHWLTQMITSSISRGILSYSSRHKKQSTLDPLSTEFTLPSEYTSRGMVSTAAHYHSTKHSFIRSFSLRRCSVPASTCVHLTCWPALANTGKHAS